MDGSLSSPSALPGADTADAGDDRAGSNGAPSLLIVEDDAAMRRMCCELFQRRGCRTEDADSVAGALARVKNGVGGKAPPIDMVLTDVRLGRDASGIDLLRDIKALDPGLPVLLMTGYATVQDAVEAMKIGAADYVTKPFERAELIAKVEQHLALNATRRAHRAPSLGAGPNAWLPGLIGRSEAMRILCERLAAAGQSSATVLITGESGTGKELAARAIHEHSPRSGRPFVPVNCAALPEHLIESELFGHVAGSFTGAAKENPGLFRAADGGTIFLDETVDMPKDTQAKLLRVLQDRRIRPVGSTSEFPVNVRVIAATNRDVEAARAAGELRDDLYYRLSVVRIHLPPMRERLEDLLPLIDHFLAKHAKRHGRRLRGIAPEALARLSSYPWPGNVRELESVIESVYALGRGETLRLEDLPEWLERNPPGAANGNGHAARAAHPAASAPAHAPLPGSVGAAGAASAVPPMPPAPPPLSLSDMEKDALIRALAVAQGNKSKAAQLLGVSRKRLYRMLHDYGLAEDAGPAGDA
ncbi:MAG: sigma-54 dependent transcriptional regulator [Planctomycetes bacterium]|nr:sigma-54 dependent transcriptional regulator [Planctomycetota bacterium]